MSDPTSGDLAGMLMAAMGCKVEADSPEGPCCAEPASCHGHGIVWYCSTHDWHEADNAEGVCGYAVMLARVFADWLRDEAQVIPSADAIVEYALRHNDYDDRAFGYSRAVIAALIERTGVEG